MNAFTDPEVTVAHPDGALPKQAFGWNPLNISKMNWTHRQTQVEQAPSLIGGKLYPAPGAQDVA